VRFVRLKQPREAILYKLVTETLAQNVSCGADCEKRCVRIEYVTVDRQDDRISSLTLAAYCRHAARISHLFSSHSQNMTDP
jgi:hypothetical protein